LADPEIDHVTVPVGAGRPLIPVTRAEKVIGVPTLGFDGVALRKIVGAATVRLMAIVDDVALK
jgi:hypothetical protein